jgi:hypothetical protein
MSVQSFPLFFTGIFSTFPTIFLVVFHWSFHSFSNFSKIALSHLSSIRPTRNTLNLFIYCSLILENFPSSHDFLLPLISLKIILFIGHTYSPENSFPFDFSLHTKRENFLFDFSQEKLSKWMEEEDLRMKIGFSFFIFAHHFHMKLWTIFMRRDGGESESGRLNSRLSSRSASFDGAKKMPRDI